MNIQKKITKFPMNFIKELNRTKNEYLTDIACLFFGFDEYINKGYILVGYLKRNEIRYIKKMIREFNE